MGYLRGLLIMGARALLDAAKDKSDSLSRWAVALAERRGYWRAVVAIASKNARMSWAVLRRGGQFDNGAQFGAWIGLTPHQHSSGGKSKLGRITKRGDTYLRTLLVQAAKSAVLTAHRRSDKISDWLLKLRERSGWQIAAVALANKNARILWAIMTKGEDFDVNHRSVKPAGSTQPAQAT